MKLYNGKHSRTKKVGIRRLDFGCQLRSEASARNRHTNSIVFIGFYCCCWFRLVRWWCKLWQNIRTLTTTTHDLRNLRMKPFVSRFACIVSIRNNFDTPISRTINIFHRTTWKPKPKKLRWYTVIEHEQHRKVDAARNRHSRRTFWRANFSSLLHKQRIITLFLHFLFSYYSNFVESLIDQ